MSTPRDHLDHLGQLGEAHAERYLAGRGLRRIARRFRTPAGEIDLVMRDGATIVFVEVKTQTDDRLGDPHERVTRPKQKRLIRAARWFLNQKGWHDAACRFDVVAVIAPPGAAPRVEHFRDAFMPNRW